MPLQDVSNDSTMMDWLRQAGHGHLLDERLPNTNATSSSPPPSNVPFGQTTSSSNYPPQSSSNYPPQSTSLPPPPPQPSFGGGYNTSGAQSNAFNRAAAFPLTDLHPTPTYGANSSSSPPVIPPTSHFTASPYNHPSSPLHFSSSPTQFLASNVNQQQLDADIEVK
jgi:hypothetical protein